MRHRRRTDANHAELRELLRQMCPAVEDTSDVGRGFPDLLVKTPRGRVFLVEIKDGAKPPSARRLTEDELRMQARWGAAYVVITTAEDAIALAQS